MRKLRRQIQRLHKHSVLSRTFMGVLSLPLLAATVSAQVATNETERLKPVVVTGSLIPTAETVGASAVDVLNTADIEKLGSTDVLEALKKVSSAFAGNANVGETINNGGFGEANVAIRNLPTLVLLNGRRLGNSSFSNGALVDVNTIPLAMIDRIEILKDGASALYGSQAIGGVVNIITKRDFNGVDISGRYGFATGKGDYEEYRASLVAGTANEKSSFIAGAQYYHADPLLSSDRAIAAQGLLERLDKNLAPPSYISPSFPGRVQDNRITDSAGVVHPSTSYILAGSPFAVGAPGYRPGLGTPPAVTGGPFNRVEDYNAAAQAQLGYQPYVRIADTDAGRALAAAGMGESSAWPLLNTPLFGTHSIQSQDRRQAFASGSHDLFGKEMQVFGEFLFSHHQSIGALAPSPVVSLANSRIVVPASNPANPFGVDLGSGYASQPRVRSRFVDSGNRIFDSQTDYYHFVGGLKGEFDNGYTYNAAYTYNSYDQIQFTRNAVNGAALDLALQPNNDPDLARAGLSRLQTFGPFVPVYNIFFAPTGSAYAPSGSNHPDTIDAISTTLFQTGRSEQWDANANITGQPFELPAGKLGFAVGGGFGSEALSIDFDGLTKIGKVPGLNSSAPTSGRRDSWAGFVEVNIPLTSPDMDVPGLYALELNVAGRYETFDPGGDSAVPKLGIRWQPLDDQITLRGTYSQSFLAPTTYQLFGGAAQNYPFLSVGGGFAQLQSVNVSNEDLSPVDAENFGGGIVISPKAVPGLTVSVDYYHIKTEDDIFRLSEQAIADDLNARGSASPFASGFTFDDNTRLTSPAPNQITSANWGSLNVPLANGASQETDGLDISAIYQLPTETAGTFTFFANANVLFSYQYEDPIIGGPYDYEGQYTDDANGIGGAQGLLPDFFINTGVSWQIRDFTYTVNARYIPEVDDLGTMHPAVGAEANDFTIDGSEWTINDYYAIDMQLAYEIGKSREDKRWYDRTRLALGVNNITDEDPPVIASSFEDNTDKSTYDILGRFVYFELSKKF